MVYFEIDRFLEEASVEVPEERQTLWLPLFDRIQSLQNQGAIDFICTHNSRRSILSQSLATALAHKFKLPDLKFWSGGAEVTFVHPNTIACLVQIGFRLEQTPAGENPNRRYLLSFAENMPPLELYSKRFDDSSTPPPYHAVLVCSKGDAACPFIPGVASRNLIPFEDPGTFDGTTDAPAAYLEAARNISSELLFFFNMLCREKQS